MPVHHRGPNTHTFTHSFVVRHNLAKIIHLRVCFWEVAQNQRTWRKPTYLWGELAQNSTQTVTHDRNGDPEAMPSFLKAENLKFYNEPLNQALKTL